MWTICTALHRQDAFDFLWFYCWCVTLTRLLQKRLLQMHTLSNGLVFLFRSLSNIIASCCAFCPVMKCAFVVCLQRRSQSNVWNWVKTTCLLLKTNAHIDKVILISCVQQRRSVALENISFDLNEMFFYCSLFLLVKSVFWSEVNGRCFYQKLNPISHKCEHISSHHFVVYYCRICHLC